MDVVYPRARGGNHGGCRAGAGDRRSIPAHAGETAWPMRFSLSPKCPGLSPRTRGKPLQSTAIATSSCPGSIPAHAGETKTMASVVTTVANGSIPAHAGETAEIERPVRANWQVYPRARGGNPYALVSLKLVSHRGLSPRTRGKPWHPHSCITTDPFGLSPRTRGKQEARASMLVCSDGSIPAHAGET